MSETLPNFPKATAMRNILFFIIMALAVGALGQQSITLLQPAAGSVWDGASTRTIAWQSQNVNLLTIAFSADNGATWQTVNAAYPATAQSYDWVVPAQPTTQGRIRLSDSENPAVFALSGLFTIPEPFITLVQPGTLHTGNAYAIQWQSSCIFTLNISLSADGGNSWTTLFSSVNALLRYKIWPLPATPGEYLLRLSDAANPEMTAVSEPFTIMEMPAMNTAKFRGGSYDGYSALSNLPPELAITFPTGGELLQGSTLQTIRWERRNTGRIIILHSLDGGVTWSDTIQHNYPAEALQYGWTVPNTPTTAARIRLVSLDQPGLESESNDFTIPDALLLITNAFGQLATGTPYPVFWSSASVSKVNLAYSSDGGSNWTTFAQNVPALQGFKNWTVPASTDQARIKIWDADNPYLSDETDIFVISNLPEANPAKYRGGSYDGYSALSNLPAELAITFPAGGETLNGSAVQTIRWERQNTGRIKILLSFDGGLTWNDTIQHNYPAEALQYAWTVPNTASTAARIRLVSLDQPGLESESGDFTIPEPMLAITNAFTELFTGTPYPVFWNSASVSKVNLAFSS
ncbi:MAG: hypothetical protein IH588_18860, partial [Anaerolineales bacterium]|nr:hypothetical protein [Anaerolineales bacterium]